MTEGDIILAIVIVLMCILFVAVLFWLLMLTFDSIDW